MSDTKTPEPNKHYGHNLYRTTFTACGKEKADVVITYTPEQVTCEVCIEEFQLQDDEAVR